MNQQTHKTQITQEVHSLLSQHRLLYPTHKTISCTGARQGGILTSLARGQSDRYRRGRYSQRAKLIDLPKNPDPESLQNSQTQGRRENIASSSRTRSSTPPSGPYPVWGHGMKGSYRPWLRDPIVPGLGTGRPVLERELKRRIRYILTDMPIQSNENNRFKKKKKKKKKSKKNLA